jgi:hypothetical protein
MIFASFILSCFRKSYDFITHTTYKIFLGDRIMNNEMGGPCGTHGKEEKGVLGFGEKT